MVMQRPINVFGLSEIGRGLGAKLFNPLTGQHAGWTRFHRLTPGQLAAPRYFGIQDSLQANRYQSFYVRHVPERARKVSMPWITSPIAFDGVDEMLQRAIITAFVLGDPAVAGVDVAERDLIGCFANDPFRLFQKLGGLGQILL